MDTCQKILIVITYRYVSANLKVAYISYNVHAHAIVMAHRCYSTYGYVSEDLDSHHIYINVSKLISCMYIYMYTHINIYAYIYKSHT